VAGANYYDFNVDTQEYTLVITANSNNLSSVTPEFCVGQQVNLQAAWSPALPGGTQTNYQWIASLDFVNSALPPVNSDGSTYPYINSDPIGTVPFQDAPGVSDVYGFESITDSFETYLVFQPTNQNGSSNIWVTLGTVTWGWSATESAWTLTATNVTQASYSSSDAFPTWLHTGHNSRGD
jgi:hypothetical protein